MRRLKSLNFCTIRLPTQVLPAVGGAGAGFTADSLTPLAINQIGNAGAEALAASPHLSQLSSLNLHGNDLIRPSMCGRDAIVRRWPLAFEEKKPWT